MPACPSGSPQARLPNQAANPGGLGSHSGLGSWVWPTPLATGVGAVVAVCAVGVRATRARGGKHGPVGPCVLRGKGTCRPSAGARGRACCPSYVQWLAPQRVAQCKGHLPLASVGRWPSALQPSEGKTQVALARPFCPTSSFLIFPLSAGTVRCPSPDLDLHRRPYGGFCWLRHARRGIGVADSAQRRSGAFVGHLASGAFRPGQLHMMYSPFETRRPDPCASRVQAGAIGRRAFTFPSGLVSAPGVLETPDAASVHGPM
ncbi:hypothetical protein H6P81_021468 [Aristolochia fimbriata]|uniref:Uncharacterized protein n=1 Tax=Aristolochia fimbriata TaxID=158543 RepID=A0AAV7DSS6_ARIFI|nr:hypothetical protein H6P81_021468 [Aristolochia fimbriata]